MFKKPLTRLKGLKQRISTSKDGKALASNFGYMMLLQSASYVFPLLTIPYLARVIGVEGFGKIAFASAVIVWFQTIADWGFNYTATRDVAQNRDNPEKVSEIFSNVLWARLLLMVLSFGLLLLAITAIPHFRENQTILLLTFLIIPGHIMFPDWFFQAMERMKYITVFNLLSKVFFTAMVFLFINERADFVLQPIILSAGVFLCGLFSMWLILSQWKIKLLAPNAKSVMKTIKMSSDVFLNNIMPNLYNSFSVVLLGFLGGSNANGLLDAGRKFVEIAQQFLVVISKVFFPFLSRKIQAHNVYSILHFSLSLMFCTALGLTAPIIIDVFYTEEFKSAITVLQIMSVSLIFLSLNNIFGTNYLIVQGHTRKLRVITVRVSILGFLLAFPLIEKFGYIGAAITITLTRALLGSVVALTAVRLKRRERLL